MSRHSSAAHVENMNYRAHIYEGRVRARVYVYLRVRARVCEWIREWKRDWESFRIVRSADTANYLRLSARRRPIKTREEKVYPLADSGSLLVSAKAIHPRLTNASETREVTKQMPIPLYHACTSGPLPVDNDVRSWGSGWKKKTLLQYLFSSRCNACINVEDVISTHHAYGSLFLHLLLPRQSTRITVLFYYTQEAPWRRRNNLVLSTIKETQLRLPADLHDVAAEKIAAIKSQMHPDAALIMSRSLQSGESGSGAQ